MECRSAPRLSANRHNGPLWICSTPRHHHFGWYCPKAGVVTPEGRGLICEHHSAPCSSDHDLLACSLNPQPAGAAQVLFKHETAAPQVEDLPLLCERHATSKLQQFDDLASIATLGFRGEALASMSFSAHLSVTTMVRNAAHGHQVSYRCLCTGRPCRSPGMPCCSRLCGKCWGWPDGHAARPNDCFLALVLECPVKASPCGRSLLSKRCLPDFAMHAGMA